MSNEQVEQLGCNAVVMRKIDGMMLRAAIKEILSLHKHLIDAKGWIQTSNGVAMMLEDHLKESGFDA